jgi:ABC-type nitrate/sulfonate/bicarbonate transport system substrate-binding protein
LLVVLRLSVALCLWVMGFFGEHGIAVDYVVFPSVSEVIPADTATQFPGFPAQRGGGNQGVPLTFQDQVAALTNRLVDAALMAEPFATQVVKNGLASPLIGTDKVLPGQQ